MLNFQNLYKPSNSQNGFWNLLKTFLQTSVFWFVFLWLIPKLIVYVEKSIFKTDFEAYSLMGWAAFILFSLLGLWSGYTMSWHGKGTPLPLDCPQKLVIAGPYQYVLNPMALAGIGQGVSVGVILGSPFVITYAISGAILWHYLVKPSEEVDLLNRFGLEYI